MSAPGHSDEIDDAAPLEAVKWSFVRRCLASVFSAHGYREVAAPPLELRGTHLMGRAAAAWPVGEDLELRADPMISLAQLYARWRRDRPHASSALTRWLLSDVVFDPAADGAHRYPAWEAVSGAVFGVREASAEIELALIAQRAATVLALSEPMLEISFDRESDRLKDALAHLKIDFTVGAATESAIELSAKSDAGARIVVARGGRRDSLLGALGEPSVPLIGLTFSVRHAASCVPGGSETYEAAVEVFFVVHGDHARIAALSAASRERARGVRIDVELRDVPLDVQHARARAGGARVIVEFGDPATHVAVHVGSESRIVPRGDLSSELRRLLR